MRKIHFKNGEIKEVSQDVADILSKRIQMGSGQWQIFSDEKGNALLFINLLEVTYID